MLWNLILLCDQYTYEIAIYDNIRCGKCIGICKDTYRITSYKFGKKHGIQECYNYDDKLIEKSTYKHDVLHGLYYNVNGMDLIVSGKYIKDLRHGLWKYIFPDGDMQTIRFISGNINGWFKSYYSSGALRLQGKQIGDIRVGEWCYYSHEGHKSKIEFYENNELVKGITYYTNGCKKLEVTHNLTIEYDTNGCEISRDYKRGIWDLVNIKMGL